MVIIMGRLGKWNESKIVFSGGGHRHSGGVQGRYIRYDGLGTGAFKYGTPALATQVYKIYMGRLGAPHGTVGPGTHGIPNVKGFFGILVTPSASVTATGAQGTVLAASQVGAGTVWFNANAMRSSAKIAYGIMGY